ncbi:MAG: DUF2029 domain-containing protein [Chloroflexi bacterium]|nr:MAG: DUF2029 domain-containing protein [Chloroflexota bacterium]
MVEAEAEARGLRSQDAPAEPSIEFSLTIPAVGTILSWLTSDREEVSGGVVAAIGRIGIVPVLAAGLVLRLFLATLPGFGVDVGTFAAWANQLAATGPWNFYDTDFFTDYAPGYLYLLWFIGELNERFHFSSDTYQYILKLPSIAADLASAYLLYRILEGKSQGVRVGTAGLYLALPFVWFTGAVWGQVDSLLAFFILLSIFFLARDRPIPAAAAYTVAFLVKPQAIAALPFLAFWGVRHYPPKIWAGATAVALVLGLALMVPFFGLKPWGLIDVMQFAASYYHYASFHAYNFWAAWPVSAYLKTDDIKYLGLSYQVWGFVLYGVSIGLVLYSLRRSEGLPALALGTSLCILLFYMFVTRMHERYVFAFFLPFLVACVLYNNRLLWTSFAGLAFIHLLNLYHAYAEFNDNELRSPRVFNWLQDANFWNLGMSTVELLSFLMLLLLVPIAAVTYVIANRPRSSEVT